MPDLRSLFEQAKDLESKGLYSEALAIYKKVVNGSTDENIVKYAREKIKKFSALADIDKTITKFAHINQPDVEKIEKKVSSVDSHSVEKENAINIRSNEFLNKNTNTKKSFYRKPWFWIVVVIILIIVIAGAGGSGESNKESKNTVSNQSESTKSNKNLNFKVSLVSCEVNENGVFFDFKSAKKINSEDSLIMKAIKEDNSEIAFETTSFEGKEATIQFDKDTDLSQCTRFDLSGDHMSFKCPNGDAMELYLAAKEKYDQKVAEQKAAEEKARQEEEQRKQQELAQQQAAQQRAAEEAQRKAQEQARAQAQAQAQAQASQSTVYVTPTGTKYHSTPSCRTIRNSYSAMSESAAVARGYTPCQVCH